MKTTTVKVEGLADLGRRLRALGADIEGKAAFGAVLAGAKIIQKTAISLAPVAEAPHKIEGFTIAPGNLRKNIVTKRVPKSQRQVTAEYVIVVRGKQKNGFASRYGAIQEFGSVKQGPRPFLRPAFESQKEAAVSKIREVLEKRIRKAEGGR